MVGCSSGCYAAQNHGNCWNAKCGIDRVSSFDGFVVCNPQWKGEDCSLPSQLNECSGNGVIQTDNNQTDKYYCKCNGGFTGVTCAAPIRMLNR